jgi:hypothetical protein
MASAYLVKHRDAFHFFHTFFNMHKNIDGYWSNNSWPIIYTDATGNRVQGKIFLLCSKVLQRLLTVLKDFIEDIAKNQFITDQNNKGKGLRDKFTRKAVVPE